jgi:hypothetical protein
MNPEIKARWAAALRSGNFRQGKRKLAQKPTRTMPMTHCCLGVLCELAVEDGIIDAKESKYGVSGTVRSYGNDEKGWASTSLPTAVSEWAGLENNGRDSLASDPRLYGITETDAFGNVTIIPVSCSEANDGYDSAARPAGSKTFDQIADLIEENL